MEILHSNKIVCSSIGLCHHLGTSDNGFERNLFEQEKIDAVMLISMEKLEKDSEKFVSIDKLRRINKVSIMGLLASQLCNADSAIDLEKHQNDIGVIICNTFGGVASSRDFINSALKAGYKNASPLIFPNTVPNAATGVLTIQLGVRGFNTTISGFNPVSYAYELLRLKKAKALFVGGIEEVINEMVDANNGHEEVTSSMSYQPFIKPMADGAAVIMMSSYQFAKENNQPILFEISAAANQFNLNSQNTRIDNFGHIDTSIIAKVMATALQKAKIQKEEVKVIISLSGTQSNQKESEMEAVKAIWGEDIPSIWYIKERIGETFGASDTLSTISAYYYLKSRNITDGYALVNGYQVGGNVSSVLIKLHS